MERTKFSVFGVVVLVLCLCRSVRGDDLISLGDAHYPTRRDAIVQQVGKSKSFTQPTMVYWWAIGGHLKRQTVFDPDEYYRIVFAKDKLDAIKDQWKRDGLTIDIKYRNGGSLSRLHNCYFTWTAPPGLTISGGIDSLGGLIPLSGHGMVFMRDIDTIKILEDGSLSITQKGGVTYRDELRYEFANVRLAPLGTPAEKMGRQKLIPTIVGYTYEADGDLADNADEDSPRTFFKKHEAPLPETLTIMITSGVPAATIPTGGKR